MNLNVKRKAFLYLRKRGGELEYTIYRYTIDTMIQFNKTQLIDSEAILNAVLKNVNAYVLLINSKVEVLFTNYYELNGKTVDESDETIRVGDLLHCLNAESSEGGCGTHALCARCSIRKAIESSFKENTGFSTIEDNLELIMDDGSVACCDVNVSGKFLEKAAEPQLVLTIHDITLLRQTQKELEVARQKAEDANLSKSVFLSNMGHEIRNPLNAIVGFSELLMNTTSPEECSQYIDIIRLNNGLLQQLVADILDLSKIEAGTLELNNTDVDINLLMAELEQIHRFKLSEGNSQLHFINRCPEPGFTIHIDQHRLMQVINNFITNAIKFTEQGEIEMGYRPCSEGLYFYVKDTGDGIPTDKLGLVFDRFVSLQKKNIGTGLGLAICKTIVEKFGGNIGVNSVLGEGSTFWFTLPYKR